MYYFKNLKIYLLDINKEMTNIWERFFKNIPNVEIVNKDLVSFLLTHDDIEGIVSPANSFGLMTGGYDKAIINYFGINLMRNVQNYILENYCGEQPVGTAFSIPIYPGVYDNKYLIHCPTMRTPEVIKDSRIIYSCMRSALIECMRKNIGSVIIPAFGACTGKVDIREVANYMRLAYEQLTNIPNEINWNSILRFEDYEYTTCSHAEGLCNNPLNPKFNSTPCSLNMHATTCKSYRFEDTGSSTIA